MGIQPTPTTRSPRATWRFGGLEGVSRFTPVLHPFGQLGVEESRHHVRLAGSMIQATKWISCNTYMHICKNTYIHMYNIYIIHIIHIIQIIHIIHIVHIIHIIHIINIIHIYTIDHYMIYSKTWTCKCVYNIIILILLCINIQYHT